MQLVCAENGTISMDKVAKSSCTMCTNESPAISSNHADGATKPNGQPYYLCTVTCCDSVNCTKPPTANLLGKAIVTKADACQYSQYTPQPAARSNCLITALDQSNCPVCIKTRQTRPRLVMITNPSTEYMNGDCSSPNTKSTHEDSGSPKPSAAKSELCSSPLLSKGSPSKELTRRSPKLQLMTSEKGSKLHSPELSSSPPILGNSSFTDYTEPYTPVCTSVNSNPADSGSHFKFGVSQKASPLNSEYSFYFSNVENHGFFRKAVPALPISIAVLFCLCNLLIPGSGTLLASLSIIFGSQTEYGPGFGYRSFCICFLSALLQFSTAIFVFGWVWSIMWGIVFIKNSLRYGEKRDIHTISLC